MYKKIMNTLFLSCLKASELIEKKMHVKLSFTERMQLKAHKMMCDACTLYEKQSLILEKGIESHVHQQNMAVDIEKLKRQITQNLEKAKK